MPWWAWVLVIMTAFAAGAVACAVCIVLYLADAFQW